MQQLSSRLRINARAWGRWAAVTLGLALSGGSSCNTYTPDLLVEDEGISVGDDAPDDEPANEMEPLPDDDVEPEPQPIAPVPTPTPTTSSTDPVPDSGGSGGAPDGPAPAGSAGAGGGTGGADGTGGTVPIAGGPSMGGMSGSGGVPVGGFGGTSGAGGSPPGGTGGVVLPTPTPPQLVDNFEDGNNALLNAGERRGYWFTGASTGGTISDFEVFDLDVPIPGLSGNSKAVHVVASGFAADGWALLGANFNDDGETVPLPAYPQAANYTGIQFYARHGGGPEGDTFSLKLPTTATVPDDDHFGVDLTVTEDWMHIRVPFDEMYLSQQGFGEEQVFDPAELVSVQFNLPAGATGFDLWIDHVEFVPPED